MKKVTPRGAVDCKVQAAGGPDGGDCSGGGAEQGKLGLPRARPPASTTLPARAPARKSGAQWRK